VEKILSDEFLTSVPESNILLLYINDEEISCVIADKKSSGFIAFETYTIEPESNPATTLKQLISTSSLLRHSNYRKVIFCSGFRRSTIIPEALFDPGQLKEQLSFSTFTGDDDELFSDEVGVIHAVNIFAVPESVYKLVTNHFDNTEVHHSSTASVTAFISEHKSGDGKYLYVIVHQSYLEIFVIHNSGLLFYNTFNYTTDEELVYYILFVSEQLNINTETGHLYLSGYISEDDNSFKLVSKYIGNVHISEKPSNYRFTYEFQLLPRGFANYLFNQMVCV